MKLSGKKFNLITWKFISNISKNKFVNNTFAWVVFVPVIAKLFSKIEEISIVVFEQKIIIDTTLPFSWSIFYFSAVSFLIGNILYKIFAPTIIVDNNSYTDFLQHGKGRHELQKYIELSRLDQSVFYDLYDDDKILLEDTKNEYFWDIWNKVNILNPYVRLIVSIFYTFGIMFIAFVFMQNMYFVCQQVGFYDGFMKFIHIFYNI